MRALSAADVVGVWERGAEQHPVDRALTVLAACSGDLREELERASIGRRDAGLMQVHEHLFGGEVRVYAECPACSERLEYGVPIRELLAGPDHSEAEFTMTAGGLALRLRLPNSLDLAAIRQCADVASAGRILAERCIVEARSGDTPVPVPALPEAVVDQAEACLAGADPRGEILIDLTCSACQHSWQTMLDIESLLWEKLSALAKRLLREVHALAGAYGWREADILAMSATRREFYLELVS